MARNDRVERPTKKSEYQLCFASHQAKKGWVDLRATIVGPLAESWDFLTRTPLSVTPTNYPLKGDLAYVVRDGERHERWQHKPTTRGDARIWSYVVDHVVYLEHVHSHHPNQTK